MPTALIAEDEPLLAAALQADLAAVWPELQVLAVVGDGLSAVEQALALQPDVLFFDIRMPGQTGLDAAAELADAWPAQGPKPFPALVFVTAYDQYALAAFDTQAVDYLVKPVQRPRLEKCKQKVHLALSNKAQAATNSEATEAPRPAAAAAAPKVDWRGLLNTWLLKHKTYPLSARRMRQEGTVVVQAAFAADGSLLECNVADSSGFAALDAAALQLVRTAAQAALASAPPGDRMTLRIPIVYELKDT